jgi:hypothetical protein
MVSAAGGIFTAPYETYREARRQDTNNDERQKDSSKLASVMAMASVKSIGMFNLSLFKGTMVDLPLAVAEGLRTVPRLYGEEVQDHGVVTDWKSGFVVAGKVSCHQIWVVIQAMLTAILAVFRPRHVRILRFCFEAV